MGDLSKHLRWYEVVLLGVVVGGLLIYVAEAIGEAIGRIL